MGLDMYAYRTRTRIPQVDFDPPDDCERIATWRKHPNLHGWMHSLYRDRGGDNADFNCAPLRLDAGDLDALERDVLSNALPFTSGFFFGESRPDERQDDLDFIAAARAALLDGFHVYYTSWW